MDVTDTTQFDTARAATDDDEPTDPLVERLAAAIDRVVWERCGPLNAAVRVLADQQLRDALRAADVVRALSDLHRPRVWADNVTRVCRHCERAWPCKSAELMGSQP